MDALAELSSEQGYEATKISDIVRRAAVARKTLYDNFSGKEEVFLGAFDAAVEEAVRRVERACAAAEGGWEEQVDAGLAAFLGYVAEDPALARMCLIEALSATPETTRRHEDAHQLFVELAERVFPKAPRVPPTTAEAVVGGVERIVYREICEDKAGQAEDLLPELSEFMRGPYLHSGAHGGANN